MKNKILPPHAAKKEMLQKVENIGFPNFEIQAIKLDKAGALAKQVISQNRNNIQISSLKKSTSNLIQESKKIDQTIELPMQSRTPQERNKPIVKYSKMPSNFDLYTQEQNHIMMPQINHYLIHNNNVPQLNKSSSCKPLPTHQQQAQSQFSTLNDQNNRKYNSNTQSANTTAQNLKKINVIFADSKQPPLSKNLQRVSKKPSSSQNSSSNLPQYQQYQQQNIQSSFDQPEKYQLEQNQQETINGDQKQQNPYIDENGTKGVFNDLFMSGQKLISTKQIPYQLIEGQQKNKFLKPNGQIQNYKDLGGNYRIETKTLTTSNSNKQVLPKLNQNEFSQINYNNMSLQQHSFMKQQNIQKDNSAQFLQQKTQPELQQQLQDSSQKKNYLVSNNTKLGKISTNNQQIQSQNNTQYTNLQKQNNQELQIHQIAHRQKQLSNNLRESPINDSSEQIVFQQHIEENTPYESSSSTFHSKTQPNNPQNMNNIQLNSTAELNSNLQSKNQQELQITKNQKNNIDNQKQKEDLNEMNEQKNQNKQEHQNKIQNTETIQPKRKFSASKCNMTTSGNSTAAEKSLNTQEYKTLQSPQNENYNNLNPKKQQIPSFQDQKNLDKKQQNQPIQNGKQNTNQPTTSLKKNPKQKKAIQEDAKEDKEIKPKVKQEPLTIQQFELNDDFFRESFDGYNQDMELSFSGTWTGYNIQQYMKNQEEEKEQQRKGANKKQSAKANQKQKQNQVEPIQQQNQTNINENTKIRDKNEEVERNIKA